MAKSTMRGVKCLGALALVAGAAVAVYAAAGDLDLTFGGDGIVQVSAGSSANYPACVVSGDGKVVAGDADNAGAPNRRWRIVRWNPDGSLDTGYGPGGSVTPFGTTSGTLRDLALDGSGRVVASGQVAVTVVGRGGKTTVENRAAVARVSADGTLDPSFGTGGTVSFNVPGTSSASANCVTTQPNGMVVVAGIADLPVKKPYAPSNSAVFVARLNANGSFDTSFGSNGITLYDITPGVDGVQPGGLALQSSGKIVVASLHSVIVGGYDYPATEIVRFLPNGAIDTAFGIVRGPSDPYDSLYAIEVETPSDRIVAVGQRIYSQNVCDMLAVRYGADGALDTSFGAGGSTVVHDTTCSYAGNVAIQGDGRIVFTGMLAQSSLTLGRYQVVTVRLLADGTVDSSYGSGGLTSPIAIDNASEAYGLAIASDGDVVVAGRTILWGRPETLGMFIARYVGN